MRIVTTGGRHWYDPGLVSLAFAELSRFTTGRLLVVHGDAPGADQAVADYCREVQIPCAAFPAFWDRVGRRAGPLRNSEMLAVVEPHKVVAFPGGVGTADCVAKAEEMGIQVVRYGATEGEGF